ncbi:2Fe-2S iron-sulfur cluster-binding protein [Pedobacter chitinilyticus]|uniref:2Fe-2S iron-sulfur cluster binding domain-containing protein n=1 Tax=Pedobacter chitinilyticus TaxID=2233776 RepID=A0A3S3PZA4_9SPHI|nr:2Fe-2S iron-sulfur cluster-binding protein [Pedobacter chitinilyticus]RWU07797.1 2Fe-2S iron-sulfur cluster binding domain-containing protein [Pedobacter chitinilyticus]
MSDINITVEDREGNVADLVAPTDMGLSLMEFLKASEYDVLATCGGMALCATCCVDVLEGEDKLNEMSDDEYAMLDTLPDLLPNSRLACQIQLKPEMEGLKVRLHAMDY